LHSQAVRNELHANALDLERQLEVLQEGAARDTTLQSP
jgi:hypothetical protein